VIVTAVCDFVWLTVSYAAPRDVECSSWQWQRSVTSCDLLFHTQHHVVWKPSRKSAATSNKYYEELDLQSLSFRAPRVPALSTFFQVVPRATVPDAGVRRRRYDLQGRTQSRNRSFSFSLTQRHYCPYYGRSMLQFDAANSQYIPTRNYCVFLILYC
jgi:hypothetical protein